MTRTEFISPTEQAARILQAKLKGSGLAVREGGTIAFESVRVAGPAGDLFVPIQRDGDGIIRYLALPERAEYDDLYEPLGTVEQVEVVAGIIRRRVGARSFP